MKCKKKILIIAVILIIAITVGISAIILPKLFVILYYKAPWSMAVDFDRYAEDFNKVKDYVEEIRFNKALGTNWLDYSESKGLSAPDIGHIDAPEEILESLRRLQKEAFTDVPAHGFNTIWIKGDYIAFGCELGRYYVIYSSKGRPTNFTTGKIRLKRIASGWYHAYAEG